MLRSSFSKITRLPKHARQLLQRPLILPIKPTQLGTINIDNRNRPPPLHNRHDNLALTCAIACNVPGELVYIGDKLRCLRGCCGSAHAAFEQDCLACDLALKGAEDEFGWVGRIGEVEACPVDGVRGGGEGVQGVPEEGGSV